MGQLFSKGSSSSSSSTTENRVLMLGLDAAGKTSLLYKLKFGNTDNVIPTIGFNMETITIDNFPMTLLEVRGQKNLWKYYYSNNKALIFVVDSANENRFQKAREELFELLEEPELANCPLLVLANKQDLANAKCPGEIKEMLNLDSIENRKCYLCGTSAYTGKGLNDDLTKQAKWYKDIVWVFYPLVPATVFGSCLYVFSLPDDYSDSYVRNAIFEHYSLVLSKVPRFIMVPYAADGSIRIKNMSYLGISCLIVSFHYSFILYCGLKMHFEMKKELKKFSVANRKLQRQFFKALIFQSLGPTFFIFLPAIPVLMIPLLPPSLEIRISWQTGWLFSIIGAYPPFDSIAFMMIVSEYKKLIERRYFRIFSAMNEKSSGADSSGSVQKMRRIVVA
ncbi:unnamed protein product [Caenorhabditis brenneri]